MKKHTVFSFLASCSILFGSSYLPASAGEWQDSSYNYTEYYSDGSYAVITITEDAVNAKASTKSAQKSYNYHNNAGESLWTYTLSGTFTYNGTTSSCTSVYDSYTIENSNWHLDSRSCYKSGKSAYGSVTMKYKVLGITTKTVSQDLTISCSAGGVIS